jgi:hypothetical protein
VVQVRRQKLNEGKAAPPPQPPQPPPQPQPPSVFSAASLQPPLALSSGDEAALAVCLAELNGSKESVEAGRCWVAAQDCTTKGGGVGVALRRRAQQLAASGTIYHDHVLFVVYLANDLLLK